MYMSSIKTFNCNNCHNLFNSSCFASFLLLSARVYIFNIVTINPYKKRRRFCIDDNHLFFPLPHYYCHYIIFATTSKCYYQFLTTRSTTKTFTIYKAKTKRRYFCCCFCFFFCLFLCLISLPKQKQPFWLSLKIEVWRQKKTWGKLSIMNKQTDDEERTTRFRFRWRLCQTKMTVLIRNRTKTFFLLSSTAFINNHNDLFNTEQRNFNCLDSLLSFSSFPIIFEILIRN